MANPWEQVYLDTLDEIISTGERMEDRTGVGTYQKLGVQLRIPLDPFPVVQGKKVLMGPVFSELRWFLSGSTNILPLLRENCNIWTPWAYEGCYGSKPTAENLKEYKADGLSGKLPESAFELGPVYGKQWRDFNGVDQIWDLIHGLKNNPRSRRHIVTAWNPQDVPDMALPPCHAFWQVHVHSPRSSYHDPILQDRAQSTGKALSLTLTQRSADMFLGVPFNISSYAALTHWLSHMTGYSVGELIMNFGDAHVYTNHVDAVGIYRKQYQRHQQSNPILRVSGEMDPVFELSGYEHQPFIYAPVAV